MKANSRSGLQWPLTILILIEGVVLSLLGLHLIPAGWAVAAFFIVIIPFGTVKTFVDFRRR